jgi:hypothetical protein
MLRADKSLTRAATLAVAAGHVALTAYFVSVKDIFARRALSGEDYDIHASQTFRVLEGLSLWGKSWVYDVSLLAGQPEGTIFDAGNKGWELWTALLHRLGVHEATAFNSFVLVVMLAGPGVVYASGRLFDLTPAASCVAAGLASALWFFDSFFHWAWWVGMVSSAASAYLGLLPCALLFRFLERAPKDAGRSVLLLVGCAVSLAVAHLIHPYVFFAVAAPLLVLYLRRFRQLPRGAHLGILGVAAFVVGVNGYWLHNALAHWHYVLDSAYYAQGGAPFLWSDFAGLLRDGSDTGLIGTRTGFRVLVLALAVAGLVSLQRAADRRALPWAAGMGVCFALAYFGVYLPGGAQTQPYRNVMPLALFATLPAATFVEAIAAKRDVLRAHPGLAGAGVVALVVLGQHLLAQVLYFLPRALPEPKPAYDGSASPLSKYGHLTLPVRGGFADMHYGLPHQAPGTSALDAAVTWVERNVPEGARVLVEHGSLGERIARQTRVEVMGGFFERNVAHAEANFFRRYRGRLANAFEIAEYLRLYNIGWVITEQPRADLDAARAALEPLLTALPFRVYRTRVPVTPLLSGTGRVRARTNVIEVSATNPREDLILSYHFHESLRCQPACRLSRALVARDRVGLIGVPAPHPSTFSIVNGYD